MEKASYIACRYMYLVEKTFKEIQSIISDTEPPGNRDNVKADMRQIQKYEFHYKDWTDIQIKNCKSLGEKIKLRKSLFFTGDIIDIHKKFEDNVKHHSNLVAKYNVIPDADMNTIINNMQIISKFVQPYAEVAAYIGISTDSTPEDANAKVLEYKRTIDNTALASQWHAIGRLVDILMHRG